MCNYVAKWDSNPSVGISSANSESHQQSCKLNELLLNQF